MSEIKFKKRDERDVLAVKESAGVTYLSFPALENTGLVSHAFSTRLGGVSKGDYATMNFSFTRGDNRDDVLEIMHEWPGLSAWSGRRWFSPIRHTRSM